MCEQVKLVFRKQLSNNILLEVAHLPARLSPHGASMLTVFLLFFVLQQQEGSRHPPQEVEQPTVSLLTNQTAAAQDDLRLCFISVAFSR